MRLTVDTRGLDRLQSELAALQRVVERDAVARALTRRLLHEFRRVLRGRY